MPEQHNPEGYLQHAFSEILRATTGKDAARKTAVRWFNRLYYDVRKWNETFIEFLHSYPGFKQKTGPKAFRGFLKKLQPFLQELQDYRYHWRYGYVESDLCAKIIFLQSRFHKDFKWLREEDPATYERIEEVVGMARETRSSVLTLAYSMSQFIFRSFEHPGDYYNQGEDRQGYLTWHTKNYQRVVEAIREYEDTSRQHVQRLHEMANEVGIFLLSVDEYEAALHSEGTQNPNVMVLGEVTMSEIDFIKVCRVSSPNDPTPSHGGADAQR